jgi:uncharacterized membrane protein
MKKSLLFFVVIFCSLGAFAQVVENKTEMNRATFTRPVLVKLIEGYGNVWRIGFVQNDQPIANNENLSAIRPDDKCFVYFPLSGEAGEVSMVSRSTVTKLDIAYDKAIEMIMADSGK